MEGRSCCHSFATPLHMVVLLLTLRLVTVVQRCLLSSLPILASPPLNAPARRSFKIDGRLPRDEDRRTAASNKQFPTPRASFGRQIEARRMQKIRRREAVAGLPDSQGVFALRPERTVTVPERKAQSQSAFLLVVLLVSPTLYIKKPVLLSVLPDTVSLDRFGSRVQGDQEVWGSRTMVCSMCKVKYGSVIYTSIKYPVAFNAH
ncbi:hypothetical protein B0H14DRAFT_2615026 [Mycena olivaceomarginata]|nr:hypothetical protein B0H14DRAFT_2615026 [Mycena olivaceomarginata]